MQKSHLNSKIGVPLKNSPNSVHGTVNNQETETQQTQQTNGGIFTCIKGSNADLIVQVGKIYIKPGDRILDCTFGKGAFWANFDLSQITLITSDIGTPAQYAWDFRKLPCADREFNATTFDPPYCHDGKTFHLIKQYQNNITTGQLNHDQVMELYAEGMRECMRVTKDNGFVFVKCQDEVASGCQRFSHVEIIQIGREIGLHPRDLFVLHQNRMPIIQQKRQLHARKNHSYLIVFQRLEKLNSSQRKALEFAEMRACRELASIRKTLEANRVR